MEMRRPPPPPRHRAKKKKAKIEQQKGQKTSPPSLTLRSSAGETNHCARVVHIVRFCVVNATETSSDFRDRSPRLCCSFPKLTCLSFGSSATPVNHFVLLDVTPSELMIVMVTDQQHHHINLSMYSSISCSCFVPIMILGFVTQQCRQRSSVLTSWRQISAPFRWRLPFVRVPSSFVKVSYLTSTDTLDTTPVFREMVDLKRRPVAD